LVAEELKVDHFVSENVLAEEFDTSGEGIISKVLKKTEKAAHRFKEFGVGVAS
jgi:hypothetical protein